MSQATTSDTLPETGSLDDQPLTDTVDTTSAVPKDELKRLTKNGLWDNNPALVQLLGLCPLLAVSTTVTNALGLGLATTLVLMGSNISVSLVRNWVPAEIRIPVFVMVIATCVTIIELSMHAYTYSLFMALGIFIPLIVTNCVIIGRAEAYASKNNWQLSAIDGFMMGIGFTLILMLLGGMREVIGQGTLFDGAEHILGEWATVLRIELFAVDYPMLLAVLPPGAFICMGFIIAARNWIEARRKKAQSPTKMVERVRVTSS